MLRGVTLRNLSHRMPGSLICLPLLMAISATATFSDIGTTVAPGPAPVPVSLPGKGEPPNLRDGMPRTGTGTPAPRKKFFGLGVGFQSRANAQGIGIEQVIAGSPADRAGFIVGTVIVEINGESTVGRSAEECTRMVRDSATGVTLKYYDPATLKLRTRTLEKEWMVLPNPQ